MFGLVLGGGRMVCVGVGEDWRQRARMGGWESRVRLGGAQWDRRIGSVGVGVWGGKERGLIGTG